MFSGNQLDKIKYFASVTKITNECFKKCVNINDEKQLIKKNSTGYSLSPNLSKNEENCLKSCSINYVKLKEFVQSQIFEDYESIKNKNKRILQDET